MTGTGHRLTGVALGLATVPWLESGLASIIVPAVAWLGATAPDWLELPLGAKRLIPHRRITHWLLLWLVLVGLGALVSPLQGSPLPPSFAQWWGPPLLGFAIGGLAHVLTDLPNPAGIPTLHPWRKVSLRWWNSGEYEPLIVLAFAALTGLSFWAAP